MALLSSQLGFHSKVNETLVKTELSVLKIQCSLLKPLPCLLEGPFWLCLTFLREDRWVNESGQLGESQGWGWGAHTHKCHYQEQE